MTFSQTATGFALACNEHGVIRNVIQDGIGITGLIPGRSLETLVQPDHRDRLHDFLVELVNKGAVIDWEIHIYDGDQSGAVRLAGMIGRDSLIIIGTPTRNELINLCIDLARINREQTDQSTSVLHDMLATAHDRDKETTNTNEELNNLNQALVLLQQDLSKKNNELEHLYAVVQKQAVTDPLTGVYNRRGFYEMGNREIERSKRYHHPVVLIMFDLDDFKLVNDTYGHAVGDEVLKETANRCNHILRKGDILGRHGGDEFAALLIETDQPQACKIAERLRQSISQPIMIWKTPLVVTISLGIAAFSIKNPTLEVLFQRTDTAMYQAKSAGRNCIRQDPE